MSELAALAAEDCRSTIHGRTAALRCVCVMAEELGDSSGCGCDLCGRDKPLTFHHLIPRAVHRTKRFIDKYGKEEMHTRGLNLCSLCHNGIHALIPKEKDLADKYNTREALLAHPAVAKHVNWVKKQK